MRHYMQRRRKQHDVNLTVNNVNNCKPQLTQAKAKAKAKSKELNKNIVNTNTISREQHIQLDLANPQNKLLFAEALKEHDHVKNRFKELYPLTTPYEKATIYKMLRHALEVRMKQTGGADAFKVLLSAFQRGLDKDNPLGYIVAVAKKELDFLKGEPK